MGICVSLKPLKEDEMINRFMWVLVGLYCSASARAANNDVDLGSPSSGPLAAIGDFFQEVVDFVGGPGVLLIAFISAAAAVGLWVVAPKAGGAAIAWVARVCIGAIVLMNIAITLTWLQSF